MNVGPLLSTMALLGGDILSLLSIIGSAVILLDSLAYNSPLHRVGKFLDMSVVSLIMGTLGQLAITFTGAQVERVGFLQFRVLIVNRLLALSFLFLLVSWFIRRSGLQPMRFWRNSYSSILRRAKQVDKLPLEPKYMDIDIDSVANQFAFYHPLAWLESWNFRRHISWLEGDIVSLDYLLNFEKEQKQRGMDSITIRKIIEAMLAWYHSEVHDDRLLNRVPRQSLPAMLQILAFFYGKSGRVHRKYRELFLSILNAEEDIKQHQGNSHGITPEQFRVEAAKEISNLRADWRMWEKSYLDNRAYPLLRYLVEIAKKGSELTVFTQFQLEAGKILAGRYPLPISQGLRYLEIIADKVHNLQTAEQVLHEITPALGLETTSALLSTLKDFQEFETYYPRINVQLRWWGTHHTTWFGRVKDTSELDRLLTFLATLAKHERLEKYTYYLQGHQSGTLFTCISGYLPYFKSHVLEVYSKHDWKQEPDAKPFMARLIDQFEESLVRNLLNTLWNSVFGSRKLRWEFSRFTDYIPYGMSSLDWTKDDDKMRPYWNYSEGAAGEQNRYMSILVPLFLAIFRQLKIVETETLFALLPKYLSVQEFTKTVKVPVEWEKSIQYNEAYDKYAGFYTQEVEVAIPKGFIDHPFTFERPFLQNAVNLLTNMDKVRETIQANKKS